MVQTKDGRVFEITVFLHIHICMFKNAQKMSGNIYTKQKQWLRERSRIGREETGDFLLYKLLKGLNFFLKHSLLL